MRDFLLTLAKNLNIEQAEELSDDKLKDAILSIIEKHNLIEQSLFQLSESFACNAELSVRIISTISRVVEKIYSERNLYEFITYCFDEFIKFLPAENISFMEKHPDFDWLLIKSASGKLKFRKFKGKIFNIETTLAGKAFQTGEPIYVSNTEKDMRFDKKLSDLPIRSVVSVPIKIKNEIIGVINFSHPHSNAFDESAIFFFVSVANLFSVILTNFKLYKEILGFNELLNKEVDRTTAELKKKNKELYKASITDPLTGLNNRRFFFQRLDEEFSKFLRYGNSFCLILFDLDNLKYINDTYGHFEGDRLIKTFSRVLKKNKRKEDIVSRIGGDEFACIIFGASAEGSKKYAERIKEELKSSYLKANVSVSGAVGCIGKGVSFKFYRDYKEFYKDVDKTLLKAKKIKDSILLIETN